MKKQARPNLSVQEVIDKYKGKFEMDFWPSGSVIIDAILGGGIPKGLFIEVYSKEGVGKSTATLHFCKSVCSAGHKVIYMDFEHAVNESQIKGIGLEPYLNDKFIFLQPVTFEDAEEILEKVVDSETALVCIDSITSMVPAKVLELSVGDSEPGLHSRFEANFFQKYKSFAKQKGITFIFINQMRVKFAMNFRGTSRVEAAGGWAQKHYMDVRLELSIEEDLKGVIKTLEGSKPVIYGANVGVTAVKNKYNKPFVEGVITIIFGKGISNVSAYRRWLVQKGMIIEKSAGYCTVVLGEEDGKPREVKLRGEREVRYWLKEHLSEVKAFVDANGGFQLISEDEEGE